MEDAADDGAADHEDDNDVSCGSDAALHTDDIDDDDD